MSERDIAIFYWFPTENFWTSLSGYLFGIRIVSGYLCPDRYPDSAIRIPWLEQSHQVLLKFGIYLRPYYIINNTVNWENNSCQKSQETTKSQEFQKSRNIKFPNFIQQPPNFTKATQLLIAQKQNFGNSTKIISFSDNFPSKPQIWFYDSTSNHSQNHHLTNVKSYKFHHVDQYSPSFHHVIKKLFALGRVRTLYFKLLNRNLTNSITQSI